MQFKKVKNGEKLQQSNNINENAIVLNENQQQTKVKSVSLYEQPELKQLQDTFPVSNKMNLIIHQNNLKKDWYQVFQMPLKKKKTPKKKKQIPNLDFQIKSQKDFHKYFSQRSKQIQQRSQQYQIEEEQTTLQNSKFKKIGHNNIDSLEKPYIKMNEINNINKCLSKTKRSAVSVVSLFNMTYSVCLNSPNLIRSEKNKSNKLQMARKDLLLKQSSSQRKFRKVGNNGFVSNLLNKLDHIKDIPFFDGTEDAIPVIPQIIYQRRPNKSPIKSNRFFSPSIKLNNSDVIQFPSNNNNSINNINQQQNSNILNQSSNALSRSFLSTPINRNNPIIDNKNENTLNITQDPFQSTKNNNKNNNNNKIKQKLFSQQEIKIQIEVPIQEFKDKRQFSPTIPQSITNIDDSFKPISLKPLINKILEQQNQKKKWELLQEQITKYKQLKLNSKTLHILKSNQQFDNSQNEKSPTNQYYQISKNQYSFSKTQNNNFNFDPQKTYEKNLKFNEEKNKLSLNCKSYQQQQIQIKQDQDLLSDLSDKNAQNQNILQNENILKISNSQIELNNQNNINSLENPHKQKPDQLLSQKILKQKQIIFLNHMLKPVYYNMN